LVHGQCRPRFEHAALVVPVVSLPERLSAQRRLVALLDVAHTVERLLRRVRGLAATDALPRGIEELEQAVRTRRRVLRVRVPRGLMLNEPRKRVPLLTAAPSELLSRVLDDLLDRPLVRNRRAAAP